MHNDLLDILSRKVQPITNEQLVNYLTGNLTDTERHEMEATMLNSGVDAEALEGLEMVGNKEKIQQYELEIQKALRDKLKQKPNKRKRVKQLQFSQLLILTGALLAFIILIWIVIRFLQDSH